MNGLANAFREFAEYLRKEGFFHLEGEYREIQSEIAEEVLDTRMSWRQCLKIIMDKEDELTQPSTDDTREALLSALRKVIHLENPYTMDAGYGKRVVDWLDGGVDIAGKGG